MSDAGTILDGLSRRLGRSVVLADTAFRVVGYSSCDGSFDPLSSESILGRRVPARGQPWLAGKSSRNSTAPLVLKPDEAIGATGAIVCPARFATTVLGYVWVVDGTENPSPTELEDVARSAAEAAVALRRRTLVDHIDSVQHERLLDDLMSENPHRRERAIGRFANRRGWMPSGAVAVAPRIVFDRSSSEAHRTLLRTAYERLDKRRDLPDCVRLLDGDHALFLVRSPEHSDMQKLGSDLAWEMHAVIAAVLGESEPPQLAVGYSEWHLGAEAASVALTQADVAAKIATAVPELGPVLGWASLGMYKVLSMLPAERLSSEIMHEGVVELLRDPNRREFVRTLERYLDLGCDGRATAAALSLHPATVKYRLKRIGEIANVNIEDGEERFLLHLLVKWARVAGHVHANPADERSTARGRVSFAS